MNVAIYCRVSTADQNNQTQERICREYCNRNNLEIFEVYYDIMSGASVTRPSFSKLLRDMRDYKFKAVVVSKLDRIGRSLSHLLSIFDELNQKGVHFIAVTQNIDTTNAAGKLQMQMLGAFAEFERNLISERTKEGLRMAKNVGKRGKDKKPRQRKGGWKKSHIHA